MKSFIRDLPALAEFFIVVSIWYDPLLLNGCFLLPKFFQSGFWEVGNAFFIRGAIFHIMALGALIWIGNIRGWPLSKFGTAISWKGTGGGLVLAGVCYAAKYCVFAIYALVIHPGHPNIIVTGLAIPVIISSQIVNSVFEEVVEAGYFIYTFRRFGMWLAILASAFLRMLYHAPYYGIEGLLGVFAAGLISAFAYWRWRQLWPLVLAHTLRNLYYFLYAVHHAA